MNICVQIWLVTFVYNILAFKLTDLENQRTDTDYEDSMVCTLYKHYI